METIENSDVHVLEVEQLVDHLAADLGQRFGLGAGAVPDRDVVAGLEQALGHGVAHAAHADPADPLLVLCHCKFSLHPHGSNSAVSSTPGKRLSSRMGVRRRYARLSSGGSPNVHSATRRNRTSAVRHQTSTMRMRISWKPAIIVEIESQHLAGEHHLGDAGGRHGQHHGRHRITGEPRHRRAEHAPSTRLRTARPRTTPAAAGTAG